MFSNKWYNWYLGVLSIVMITIFIIMPMYSHYYGDGLFERQSNSEKIRSQLKSEYGRIKHLTGVSILTLGSTGKDGNGIGTVKSSLSSMSDLQDILRYYDGELKKNGWTFKEVVMNRIAFCGHNEWLVQ